MITETHAITLDEPVTVVVYETEGIARCRTCRRNTVQVVDRVLKTAPEFRWRCRVCGKTTGDRSEDTTAGIVLAYAAMWNDADETDNTDDTDEAA